MFDSDIFGLTSVNIFGCKCRHLRVKILLTSSDLKPKQIHAQDPSCTTFIVE